MELEDMFCEHITCLSLFERKISLMELKDNLGKVMESFDILEPNEIIANVSEMITTEEAVNYNAAVKCKLLSNSNEKTLENKDFINKIQECIKDVSECMTLLGKILQKFHGLINIQKDIISLCRSIIINIKTIFNHCKESNKIYEGYTQQISADLSLLFKSTYETQKIILEHLEKFNMSEFYSDEVKLEFVSNIMEVLEVISLLKDIDLMSVVNTLRSLNRILTTKKILIRDKIDIERLFATVCTCVKDKLDYCWSLIQKESFNHEQAGKKCTNLIKILRFLVGMMLQLTKEYSKDICGDATQSVIDVLITLEGLTPIEINSSLRGFPMYEDFCSSVLSVTEPMLLALLEERDFIFAVRSSGEKIVGNSVTERQRNLSILLILERILILLAKSSECNIELWMKELTSCADQDNSIVNLVLNYFEKCIQDNLDDVLIPSSIGAGKPARDVSLYEYTYVRICAFISTVPSALFYVVERCLLKYFFVSSKCSLLVEDIITFVARWTSETLCFNIFDFFAHIVCAVFQVSSISGNFYEKSSQMLRRLVPLITKIKKEYLFDCFHPSQPEYLSIWLSIDIDIFDSKWKEKFFNIFLPSSLKLLEDYRRKGKTNLMVLTLTAWENCLKLKDSLDFVSPIHRVAVVDILLEVFSVFQKEACGDIDEDFFCLILNLIVRMIECMSERQITEVLEVISVLLENNTSELLQLSCCYLLSALKLFHFSDPSQYNPRTTLSQVFFRLLLSSSIYVRVEAMKSLKEFAEVTSHSDVVCYCLPESLTNVFSSFLNKEILLDCLSAEEKKLGFVDAIQMEEMRAEANALENNQKPQSPICDLSEEKEAWKDTELESSILKIREYLKEADISDETAIKLKLLANDIHELFQSRF